MIRIQFNALDKNSSGSHSMSVNASSKEELQKAWEEFKNVVNAIFWKWYYDNVIDDEETTPEGEKWAKELDLID